MRETCRTTINRIQHAKATAPFPKDTTIQVHRAWTHVHGVERAYELHFARASEYIGHIERYLHARLHKDEFLADRPDETADRNRKGATTEDESDFPWRHGWTRCNCMP